MLCVICPARTRRFLGFPYTKSSQTTSSVKVGYPTLLGGLLEGRASLGARVEPILAQSRSGLAQVEGGIAVKRTGQLGFEKCNLDRVRGPGPLHPDRRDQRIDPGGDRLEVVAQGQKIGHIRLTDDPVQLQACQPRDRIGLRAAECRQTFKLAGIAHDPVGFEPGCNETGECRDWILGFGRGAIQHNQQ